MSKINYEIMILLNEAFNDSDLKTWAFNHAKALRKLSATEISVVSRGKRELMYEIKTQKRGNYIQINFLSTPKFIEKFIYNLKYDSNVLRYLILNKK